MDRSLLHRGHEQKRIDIDVRLDRPRGRRNPFALYRSGYRLPLGSGHGGETGLLGNADEIGTPDAS